MDAYRLSVFAHIFSSILLVGLALFWVIMDVALRRRFAPAEALAMLGAAQASRWPHVAVPYKLRLPLPWLTWAVISIIWASGIVASTLGAHALARDWWLKWLLVAILTATQLAMTRRVVPSLFRPQLLLLLVTIGASAWLTRFH
jgi:hypothetical protein